MSLKSEMNALADQVRRLCNKTGTMTITAMTNNLKGVSAGTDATGADASITDVLKGKKFVGANGYVETGSMTNNGAVSKTLNTSTKSYTIPAGYHNGSGKVSITTQTKSVKPSSSSQTVYPDSGKVLSAVTVAASAGKSVYSGTVTGSGKKLSINVGATASSSDTFILFYAGTDNYDPGNVGVTVITSWSYSGGQTNATCVSVGMYSDNEFYPTVNKARNVTTTISGTTITLEAYYDWFAENKPYVWYLIKG